MGERWVDRGDGTLHLIDDSGSVLAVQKPPRSGSRKVQDKRTHCFMLDSNGRKVWVPKGTNPDDLPRKAYPPSDVTWLHVCTLIMKGKTLTEIGAMEEFPSADILWHWMAERPEYREQYQAAKKMRAEYRADLAMSIANDEDIDEENVPGRRLRAELLKWGAEMDDRQAFGKQTKVVGDVDQPVVFQVNTGVPDPQPDQGGLSGPPPVDVISVVEDADEREG